MAHPIFFPDGAGFGIGAGFGAGSAAAVGAAGASTARLVAGFVTTPSGSNF